MPELFDHTDYRAFLREYLDQRKRKDSFFSLRYFAQKVGTDAGTVVKILQGQLHLSQRLVPGVVASCKLDEKQAEYFRAMVDFGKARGGADIRRTFERMTALKGVRSRTLEERQYAFYQSWVHSAVRATLGIRDFRGDWKTLGASLLPPVPAAKVKESVALLESIGLIHRGEDGVWRLGDAIISTGERWRGEAIREFQSQTLDLAKESLLRDPSDLREHSTVTLTLRRSDLPLLKRRAAEFRQDLLKIATEATEEDAVFQVNLQIFPMALLEGEP